MNLCQLVVVASIALVVLTPGVTLQADDEAAQPTVDLKRRVQSFAEDFAHTAIATRTRTLTALRNELLSKPASFSGQLIGFSEINLKTAVDLDDWRRRPPLGWEFRGLTVPPPGCDGASREQCAEIGRARIRTLLPDGDRIHMLIVRDAELMVYALTQNQEILDTMRSGTRVQVVVWPQGMSDGTVVAVLESAEIEASTLSCENGHSFPADSGFTFCPRCGQSLKPST